MNEGIAGVSLLAPCATFTFANLLLVPETQRTPPSGRAMSNSILPYPAICRGDDAATAAVDSLQLRSLCTMLEPCLEDHGRTAGVGAS